MTEKNWKTQIKFDPYAITARKMNAFFKAAQENDLEMLAGFYTLVLVEMPKEWGDPQNADDLLDKIPYPYFQQLSTMFVEAFKDAQKN